MPAAALVLLGLGTLLASPPPAGSRPRPIPDRDLDSLPVIWGSECVLPDGSGLSFGGCHQSAEDGASHTRIREGGAWKEIVEDLRARNGLQGHAADLLLPRIVAWRDNFAGHDDR